LQEVSDTVRALQEEVMRLRRQVGQLGQVPPTSTPETQTPQVALERFMYTYMAQSAEREVDHYREQLERERAERHAQVERERAERHARELRSQDEKFALLMALLGQHPGKINKKPPKDF
jgi:hypothetical protein